MDIILHHYPQSPYSEKIRAMFGYTGLSWYSLPSPPKPPRPNVDPLTGGYRRIPVAQIGADILCDTRIIATEIATLTQKPLLSAEDLNDEVLAFCNRTEQEVFVALFSAIPSRLAFSALFKQFSLWQIPGFLLDRMKMTRGSSFKMLPLFEAQTIVNNHLIEMEARLSEPFLFGEQPCIADFSVYPILWMLNDIAPELIPHKLENLSRWFNQMQQFGHGHEHPIDRKQAFEQAKQHEPKPIDEHWQTSDMIGKTVCIAPDDYAKQPVEAELVGETTQRWVLKRQTDQFGTLHVHFPKAGYQLSAT